MQMETSPVNIETAAALHRTIHNELNKQFNSNSHRQFFIGFDQLFNQLDNKTWKTENNIYPPHNIVRLGDDSYAIELAVAGFKQDELDIEFKEAMLSIKGVKADNREYDHKGISSRQFVKTFRLAEHVQVIDSVLEYGILSITLKRVIPEEKRAKKIKINSARTSIPTPALKELSAELPKTIPIQLNG